MKYIGLDVGNGTVGMAIKQPDGTLLCDTYSSVYGLYDPEIKDVHPSSQKKPEPANVFSLEGRTYVLGYRDVLNVSATPVSAYDRENRISRKEFQILTKLALIDAATKDGASGVIEVALSLGTPAEDYREEQIKEIEKWFREPVTGTHNNDQIVIMVKHIEFASQPIAVLMDVYLDNDGYVAVAAIENERVLVLDSGSGTLDMTEFDGLSLIQQSSGPVGMNDVYRKMIKDIRKTNPKVRIDAFELEYQLRKQDGHEHLEISYGPFSLDVTQMRIEAMNVTWEQMVGIITTEYPDRLKFHRILLAGGTGEAFKSYFSSWMESIILSENSQLAIARGLLKYLLANFIPKQEFDEK